MSRKPVIVGVDGSPESVRAAALGWRIAQAARTECRLVHAVPDVWAVASLAQVPVYSPQLERDLVDDARRQLAGSLADALPGRAVDKLEIRIGQAALVLSDVVKESGGAELVALGGKHHGALARRFGGSTAHFLIRTLDVPVLVAGPSPRPVERVLTAVDLSEFAPATLAAAEWIAGLLAARLRVLHVVEPIKFPIVVPVTLDDEEFYRRSAVMLGRLLAPLKGVPETDRVIRRGVAAETIETEAAGWPADLIVVGSHGKGWVDRLIVGSVTEWLLNRLPASLLIVPVTRARRAAVRPRRVAPSRTSRKKARHESR